MLQPENLDQLLFNRDCKLSKNVQGVFQAPLCEPKHALVPPSRNPKKPWGVNYKHTPACPETPFAVIKEEALGLAGVQLFFETSQPSE